MRCRPDNLMELSEFLRGSRPSFLPSFPCVFSSCMCYHETSLCPSFFDQPRSQQTYDRYNTERAIIFRQTDEQDFAVMAAREKKWHGDRRQLFRRFQLMQMVHDAPSVARQIVSGRFGVEPVVLIETVKRYKDTICQ